MTRLRLLASTLLLGLLVGCAGPEQAPDGAFDGLPPQTYPFDVVWECLIEGAENLGFKIEDAARDGSQGSFGTDVQVTFTNSLANTEQGQRLQATIVETGDKDQSVRVAASRLERKVGGPWTWVRSDDELRARFEDAYRTAIRTRYRGQANQGGD